MDDGSGIDFGDALKYPSLEFVEKLYVTKPPDKGCFVT